MVHSTCGWQVKLCDPSLTVVIPERCRDEHRTHNTTLYKCPVYFTYLLSTVDLFWCSLQALGLGTPEVD